MHQDHYSTRGLQFSFKRTKLVKPDLLPDRLAGRRHYFVTLHLIGYTQMRHRSYETT